MYDSPLDPAASAARLLTAYELSVLRDMAAVAALRNEWEQLWFADPEADLFLSWSWLARVLADNKGRWRVYVLREVASGRIRCILPVHDDRSKAMNSAADAAILRPAGRLGIAEYTGLLCDPSHEEPAIYALAAHLSREPWKRLSLGYIPAIARAQRLAAAFQAQGHRCGFPSQRINGGATDMQVSPRVPLPVDFEGFLAQLSRSRKQKIRRALRAQVETGDMRLTMSDRSQLDLDIDRLMDLWRLRWKGEKSERSIDKAIRRQRRLFDICRAIGVFNLSLLWLRDRPVAGIGLIEDHRRNSLLVKLIGRDPTTSELPVGLLLHALTIRWAIGRGIATYDFGHGDEPYKFSFGARPLQLTRLSVKRPRQYRA